MIGQRAAHVPQRRDKAITRPPVLHAFAHRHDLGVAGHHVVIDHDAAFHLQPGRFGQRGAGADTHSHDHDIGGKFAPVLQPDRRDMAARTHDLRRIAAGHDGLPAPFQLGLEQIARCLIQLALHQGGHQVDDRDGHPAQRKAVRRLQPQQAAADHHSGSALFGGSYHPVHIVQIAKRDYACQILARHWNDKGIRPGGDQQAVVSLGPARLRGHCLRGAVDGHNRIACHQRDAVGRIPIGIVDDDFGKALFACQHGRKHDAVIVHARLCTEDRDLKPGGIAREDFFHRAAPGHAIADHHQSLLHCVAADRFLQG